MQKGDKVILVAGATGRQGGAVARHLLGKGWRVRALTRKPTGSAATKLRELGAEITQGDLDDLESLKKAVAETYGVFGVQNYWEAHLEGEIRQGRNLAKAAKDAGVQHFVYASVGAANRNTGLAQFESKLAIEKYIRELAIPATFLRPVTFMENYYRPKVYRNIHKGRLVDPVKPDVTLQLIAVDDIGAFATLVFERPAEFIGQAIEIAGDQLSNLEIAAIFGKVLGRSVRYRRMSAPVVRFSEGPEYYKMSKWLNEEGFAADIEDLHTRYGDVQWTSFETWLRNEGWDKKTHK